MRAWGGSGTASLCLVLALCQASISAAFGLTLPKLAALNHIHQRAEPNQRAYNSGVTAAGALDAAAQTIDVQEKKQRARWIQQFVGSVRGGGSVAIAQKGGKVQQEPNWYMRALYAKPILTKGITSFIICGLGNLAAQSITARRMSKAFVPDLMRVLLYALIGGFYLAPVVHHWFGGLQKWVPETTSPTTGKPQKWQRAVKMVAIDQGVGTVFINGGYIFLFAALTAIISANSTLKAGYLIGSEELRNTLWPVLKAGWCLWPAANFFNFLLIPPPLQMLWVNGVGFLWSIILSLMIR